MLIINTPDWKMFLMVQNYDFKLTFKNIKNN